MAAEDKKQEQEAEKKQHVQVAVLTTSGSWPVEGFESVPAHQKVSHQLVKAARELHITDATNWVARVGEIEIDTDKNYLDLDLHGSITIDFGPREGGGGSGSHE